MDEEIKTDYFDDTLSDDQYRMRPAISRSDLLNVLKSVEYYEWVTKNPKKKTEALVFGNLLHTFILERDKVKEKYYSVGDITRKTNKFKDLEKEVWVKEGLIAVTDDELALAAEMTKSFDRSKTASLILKKAEAVESSAFWIDKETGLSCKAKIDIRCPRGLIADIKTTDDDASPANFRREIVKWMLDVQGAFYLDGANQVSGDQYQGFVLIVIEKKPPYGLAIYELNEAVIEAGRAVYRRALNTLSSYKKGELQYKGYPDEIVKIDMAGYGFDVENR